MEVFIKDGDEYKPLSDDFTVLSKSDLTSNYVTKAEQADAIKSAVDSRFKNHVHKDKVFEDEVLVAQFKERFGTEPKEVDLDARRKQWETANLRPVQEDLNSTRAQMESLAGAMKYSQMRDRFKPFFNDAFIERIEPNKPSLAEVMVGDQIEFDVQASSIGLKGSQMSIEDFARELLANEKYKRFAREPERNTTDAKVKQDSVSGASGPLRRSQMTEEQKAAYKKQYGSTVPKVEGKPAFMQLKL